MYAYLGAKNLMRGTVLPNEETLMYVLSAYEAEITWEYVLERIQFGGPVINIGRYGEAYGHGSMAIAVDEDIVFLFYHLSLEEKEVAKDTLGIDNDLWWGV